MKYIIPFLFFFFPVVASSQIYTFDCYAHTSYINHDPGEVILRNDNWVDNIEYTGSGGDYHVTYIYDLYDSTIESIVRDSSGVVVDSLNVIDNFNIILNDINFFYVYNPRISKYSLFYINDNDIPILVIESLLGEGLFSKGDDFIYKVLR